MFRQQTRALLPAVPQAVRAEQGHWEQRLPHQRASCISCFPKHLTNPSSFPLFSRWVAPDRRFNGWHREIFFCLFFNHVGCKTLLSLNTDRPREVWGATGPVVVWGWCRGAVGTVAVLVHYGVVPSPSLYVIHHLYIMEHALSFSWCTLYLRGGQSLFRDSEIKRCYAKGRTRHNREHLAFLLLLNLKFGGFHPYLGLGQLGGTGVPFAFVPGL